MSIKSWISKRVRAVGAGASKSAQSTSAQPNLRKLRRTFNQSLFFSQSYPLLFVSNAKAACSTIKRSIWHASEPETLNKTSNVHNRKEGPFVAYPFALEDIPEPVEALIKFSLVRNPYSKFLSAYRDKVSRLKSGNQAWAYMADRYGFSGDTRPSMETLLRCIAEDDPHWVDPHFARQTVNLSIDLIDYDVIGHFEHMKDVEAFLGTYGIPLTSHRRHRTNAGGIEDFTSVFSTQEIDLIGEIYADDFATFHYAFDPKTPEPKAKIQPKPVREDLLKLLLSLNTVQNGTELHEVTSDISTHASELFEHPLLQPDTGPYSQPE